MTRQAGEQPGADESNAKAEKNGLNRAAFHQPPADSGVALDQLSAALAGMLDSGDDPYAIPDAKAGDSAGLAAIVLDDAPTLLDDDDRCEISPRSILEAMLFVGSPTNEPLTSRQVAALMRGVRPSEIDTLVRDLNRAYEIRNCPYKIVAEGPGYRLKLRDQYVRVREKFYGRARQARLSHAAIEVLSAVAYQPGTTADDISRLRGIPSGPILLQLVRRQLLRIERGDQRPRRVRYFTTPRFLELFGLESLDDLPRSEDLEAVG